MKTVELTTVYNATGDQLEDYLRDAYGYDDIDFLGLSMHNLREMIIEFKDEIAFMEFSN